jgi:hypothetical protein
MGAAGATCKDEQVGGTVLPIGDAIGGGETTLGEGAGIADAATLLLAIVNPVANLAGRCRGASWQNGRGLACRRGLCDGFPGGRLGDDLGGRAAV